MEWAGRTALYQARHQYHHLHPDVKLHCHLAGSVCCPCSPTRPKWVFTRDCPIQRRCPSSDAIWRPPAFGGISGAYSRGVVYVLLWRTPLGFHLRAVGSSTSVARAVGINVPRSILKAIMLSGGLAGVAGVIETSYTHTRLKEGISPGYGFSAILVTLMGQLHPVGVLIAAVLFSALTIGAEGLQVSLQVPDAVAEVIQALVVLFVIVGDAIAKQVPRKAIRRT